MVLILLFFFKFSISGKKTTKNEYKFHPYGVSQIIKEKLLKWMFISYPLALHLNFSTEIPFNVCSTSVIFLKKNVNKKSHNILGRNIESFLVGWNSLLWGWHVFYVICTCLAYNLNHNEVKTKIPFFNRILSKTLIVRRLQFTAVAQRTFKRSQSVLWLHRSCYLLFYFFSRILFIVKMCACFFPFCSLSFAHFIHYLNWFSSHCDFYDFLFVV